MDTAICFPSVWLVLALPLHELITIFNHDCQFASSVFNA